MLAYHNDPSVKAKYIARFKAHMEADEVIQGTGFENGKGCFVGCTLDRYDHSAFPNELGWPEWLARLADTLFEACKDRKEGAAFGLQLLEMVKEGVDLEPVRWKLAIWRHEKDLTRLDGNNEPYAEQCRAAIRQVINYCQSQIIGDSAESARSAAAAASASAAESARSAAWSASRSAAAASASAAESARSAAWSASRSASRSAHYDHMKQEREMLLKLIGELEV